MNKYKVFYYMSVLVLIVNAFAMVGTLLGWFYFVESKYLFWINLVLLSIFNRLEKKEKNDEQVSEIIESHLGEEHLDFMANPERVVDLVR